MQDVALYTGNFAAMGTQWQIQIWDSLPDEQYKALQNYITAAADVYEKTYSRFIKTSLLWQLSGKIGIVEVPTDFVNILRLYNILYTASGGVCTPCIGFTLSDMGYDMQYSLESQTIIRTVPDFTVAITIIDDTHVEFHESVLLDFGALGKGYFVDIIRRYVQTIGIKRFLVNGSGDIYYEGNGVPITCGLEHPLDHTKVIGTIEIYQGALCASASTRRAWGNYHHIIHPLLLQSPTNIIASWVLSESTAMADGLATTLFLCNPETLLSAISYNYCILNQDLGLQYSPNFTATFF